MELDALEALARSLSRDQFIARLPNPFLLRMEGEMSARIGFDTVVIDPRSAKKLVQEEAPQHELEILEVKKAPGNPYPDRISVGRARNCDLVMRDPSVSKLHAHFQIAPQHAAWVLCDLDSQNGTWINGRLLAPHQIEPVLPGDIVQFGSVSVKILAAGELFDLLQGTRAPE